MKQIKDKKSPNPSPKNEFTSLIVTAEVPLMKFLIDKLPGKNRNNIKSLLCNNQISVDEKIVNWFNYPLKPGQQVTIEWDIIRTKLEYRGIRIIYEDPFVIVIEKDAGILSISTEKEKEHTAYSILSRHVKEENPSNRIFVVHRLDRETSGIMIFAKSEEIQARLQERWNDTIIERTYVAVAEGSIEDKKGTIISYLHESKALIVYSSQDPNSGQKAVTHFKVVKKNEKYSLLEVNLETGRKNQIRVHLQAIGHSIIGDKKYGATTNPIRRLGLHAKVLTFAHPVQKKILHFETEIPKSFLKLF